MARSVRTIRDDLSRGHSLPELAASALLSPFYFHHVFRELTSSTPARFRTAERMAEAKRLLATTPISVTDICMRVGYSSLGSFTVQFGRLVGVSPGRFRELIAKRGAESFTAILLRLQAALVPPGRGQAAAIVTGGPGAGAVAAVGLFPDGIPQGAPAACAILRPPGVAVFGGADDGDYHVLAMCFHPSVTVAEALAASTLSRRFVGGSTGPVRVRGGRATPGDPIPVELRPARPVDPPLVLALPLVLAAESLTGKIDSQ